MDITIIIAKLKEEMKKLFATKEDVPTKTSDLINDNDFITNSDSRLSDSRTPTSHNHGQISNDGKITREAVIATSTDKIIITDADDYDRIKRTNKLLADHIQDTTAHSNIGSSANATQATINTNIDTALSGKEKSSNKVTSISSSNTDTQYPSAKATYNALNTKANINHTHENISDSGWQNVIFESGFQNYDTNHPVRYRRIGKIVHLEGIIKNTNAFTPGTTEKKVAFIDDVYCRPSYPQTALMQGSDGNKFLLTINPTGDIDVSRYGTTTATTEVTAGRWLNCYATWMIENESISYPTLITEYARNIADNGFLYTIQLKNSNNNQGISSKNIQFYLDGNLTATNSTNSNGLREYNIPYSTWSDHNNHTLRFDFIEDETYRASQLTTTVSYNSVCQPTTIVWDLAMTGGLSRLPANIDNINTVDDNGWGSGWRYYYPDGYTTNNSTIPMIIKLEKSNGDGLNGKSVKIYINNALQGTVTTEGNGYGRLLISKEFFDRTVDRTFKATFSESLPYAATTKQETLPRDSSNDPIVIA